MKCLLLTFTYTAHSDEQLPFLQRSNFPHLQMGFYYCRYQVKSCFQTSVEVDELSIMNKFSNSFLLRPGGTVGTLGTSPGSFFKPAWKELNFGVFNFSVALKLMKLERILVNWALSLWMVPVTLKTLRQAWWITL